MSIVLMWEAMCLILLYLVFCRSVMVNSTTTLDTRIAVWASGLAALIGLGAPIYAWQPDVVTMSLMVSVLLMQIATAYRWRFGVPEQFIKDQFKAAGHRQGYRP